MREVLDVLAAWQSRPYRYGVTDCALFAGEVAWAKSGRHDIRRLLDRLIGTYKDHDSGMAALDAALRADGCSRAPGEHPLETACRHFFGEPCAPLQARRYDVVLGDWGEGTSLGICEGHRIVAVAEDGLIRFPLTVARKAWHVEGS
jgi:hypothetical protein